MCQVLLRTFQTRLLPSIQVMIRSYRRLVANWLGIRGCLSGSPLLFLQFLQASLLARRHSLVQRWILFQTSVLWGRHLYCLPSRTSDPNLNCCPAWTQSRWTQWSKDLHCSYHHNRHDRVLHSHSFIPSILQRSYKLAFKYLCSVLIFLLCLYLEGSFFLSLLRIRRLNYLYWNLLNTLDLRSISWGLRKCLQLSLGKWLARCNCPLTLGRRSLGN